MGTGASGAGIALQSQINAQQTYDALSYGIKSIDVCRSAWGAGPAHVAQIEDAIAVAEGVLGRSVGKDNSTRYYLGVAKKKVGADLAGIKARVRSIGTGRQLRLALAG